VSRVHRMAAACLALLCAFTIAAGAAVARLLPPRLALWHIPVVTGRPAGPAGPVLPAAGSAGADGTAAARAAQPRGVAAALSRLPATPALGPHVGAVVTDLRTGQVLYSRAAGSAFAPASTAKLAVATAALQALGATARFTTRVTAGPPGTIVLVGGGDPALTAGRVRRSYPQAASLAALAARTARSLRAAGRRSVRLEYDTSLYSGLPLAPGWPHRYITTGNVTAITALEVDQGRLTASGQPQDASDWANPLPRSPDPATQAAGVFDRYLAADGVAVRGAARPARSASGRTLARVQSPPLAQLIALMLTDSNNVIAENLARHLAIATGHPATFAGGAAAEESVLRGLGVTGGVSLVDGSGLSPRDRITPAALIRLLALAADRGTLRPVLTGLPVAGFSGTLAPHGSAFASVGRAGLGVIRAKTGNLTTVAGLAGIVYDRGGELLSFAFMADQLPAGSLTAAGAAMAKMATALAGCGCSR
jgi:D-alanyl-D-alanine carboxypeptidase